MYGANGENDFNVRWRNPLLLAITYVLLLLPLLFILLLLLIRTIQFVL